MKNQLLLFFLLATTQAFAQFSYGIKAGASVNHFDVKQMPGGATNSLESSLGYQISLYGQIQMGRKLSLAPELQLSQRGGSATNLVYVDLPVLVTYRATSQFDFEAGPGVSYLLAGDVNGYTRYDYGVNGGIKFYTKAERRVALFARYYYGIAKIATQGDDISSTTWSQYNRSIQFGISYKLK